MKQKPVLLHSSVGQTKASGRKSWLTSLRLGDLEVYALLADSPREDVHVYREVVVHVVIGYRLALGDVCGAGAADGVDGKSAYQIWLDLGNSGSEQDFINSLKPKVERHAPTGYILNTSSEPWTLVFDNGCILDDVWHWNNNLIFRPGNNGNLNNRSIPTYSIPDLIMKVIRGVLIPSDFQTYDGGWFDQKTRIINPVNDAEEYDWNSITPEKRRRFIRCMYELGIWDGATVESFGAVRKAGN